MDSVFVRSLVVQAILGIEPQERVTPQPVRISLTFATDIRPAARTDAIADALNYARAAELAAQTAHNGQFQLAETLAEEIATCLLAEFPTATGVRVEVEKPEALSDAAGVGVSIERNRHP